MIRSCLFLFAALLTGSFVSAATGGRPDIIFIYCDDLRWDALGVVQREQGDTALRAKLQAAFDRQSQAVGFTWPAGWGPNGESPPAPADPKKK